MSCTGRKILSGWFYMILTLLGGGGELRLKGLTMLSQMYRATWWQSGSSIAALIFPKVLAVTL
jgi:hypothetical protein